VRCLEQPLPVIWDQCTTVYTVYGNCGDDWSSFCCAWRRKAPSFKQQARNELAKRNAVKEDLAMFRQLTRKPQAL